MQADQESGTEAHIFFLPAGRVVSRRSPPRCRAADLYLQRVHVHAQLFLVPLMCEVVTITQQEHPSIHLQTTRQLRGWVGYRSKAALSQNIPYM